MKHIKDLDKVYNQCVAEGNLQEPEEIDFEKAKSLLDNVKQDMDTLKDTIPIMEKKKNVSMIWSSQYEIMRQLVQGILLLEKIRSENHQCLYAHICTKHKEWEIDWETIEIMRLLRNGVHYEGRPVSAETWKEYKLKFQVYIHAFIKILKQKLDDFK
ncbi:MAG: hypothetical protein KKF46_04195 [Nanoarchaeota archaeon]|nr:hypothetical protein [Nanoarchaeota archaeon]MBU1321536.1 hypothetical protein [Nanoarchaeota archaeon]MBU1597154.1 hypothetical protein [Nanoarchaeota archaeon]MBU2441161.1 hypothetical protein [Nanoarchaeota archaeon]